MAHHAIDKHPIPREKEPIYINEPRLIDRSKYIEYIIDEEKQPEAAEDNIRVYVPLDLNREAILRRLDHVIAKYGEASEQNEFAFAGEVYPLISQLEIYDQLHFVKNMPESGSHSAEGIALVKDIIDTPEDIPDACAETFPFMLIDRLREEFL